MEDPRIEDLVARHQAKLLEEYREPAIESFNARSPSPLPQSVCEFFRIGERLFGSSFQIDPGNGMYFFVQNFAPLNSATIDACEGRNWEFLDVAGGNEGESLLVSLNRDPTVFIKWIGGESPEDTGIAFVDFLSGVRQVV